MKRGTASRVFLGGNKVTDDFDGLLLLSQVILGKKSGMFTDHTGLYITDNVMLGKGIARVITAVVHGTSPLSLPDAIADSLSYVKAFGGTEQRNLPSGFTELQYIESTGTQWIDTGITPRATKLQVNFKMQSLANTYQSFFGAVANPTPRDGYRIYRQESTAYFCVQSGSNAAENVNTNLNNPIECQTTVNNGGRATVVVNGVTSTVGSGMNTQFDRSMLIFTTAFGPDDAVSGTGAFKLWSFQIIKDDEEKFNGIPAKRNSDNVIGMYDTVSGRFFTNAGTGTFVAGPEVVPTPDTPMDIVCNNGVLKLSPNLFDKETLTDGYIADDGTITSSSVSAYSRAIPVTPNTTYVLSGATLYDGNSSIRIHGYSAQDTWVEMLKKVTTSTPTEITNPIVFTTGSTDYFIRFSYVRDNMQGIQLEQGSTATEYKPYGQIYADGTVETIADSANHTATVATLLGVGDYKDEQNINTGAITRNVGVKVLNGTENWAAIGGTGKRFRGPAITNALNAEIACSHYGYDDASDDGDTIRLNTSKEIIINGDTTYTSSTDFANWLADQYNAGTPVIVIYPLATATTESVTGQTLQVQAGDNTLEITQASMNGLELEAQYTKVA